ncbi:MAG: nucleotidyltransferase domain-containing protein [Chloroflexota bacterium]|nr:nucleotidyltransferase domain-containing protein [Chloroflexota bacterium]
MTDRLSLPCRYRRQIEALLRTCLPGVEAWAYGSRVNGRSHPGSDLDLALRLPTLEPIPDAMLRGFKAALEQSNIPILVQVHDWARLPESFHREIERNHVALHAGHSDSDG